MKTKNNVILSTFLLIGLMLVLTTSCTKEHIYRKRIKLTWENPNDIVFGTTLSEAQLNATASVPGTFEYDPPLGTRLTIGNNQELTVNFTPTDSLGYLSGSKTVEINVLAGETVTDIDGNVYNAITIGTQKWLMENLKTTRFNDGSSIPIITDGATWFETTTPAYCYNKFNTANKATYGALYNWYAVNSGKLCPEGWHVPTDEEWTTLINFLGGEDAVAIHLRETGTKHWPEPNESDNSSGFTALPGGSHTDYILSGLGYEASWWSSTEENDFLAWSIIIYYHNSILRYDAAKTSGFSVRCIKN